MQELRTYENRTMTQTNNDKFEPLKVGEILRLHENQSFRVWRVKGVHYSGIGIQDLVTIEALDIYNGVAFGCVIHETQVPIVLLKSIPHLESM